MTVRNNGLSCGGIERQIVAAAQYFHAKENPVRLLCFNIESQYGNDFFLPEARRFCTEVQQFSLNEIDKSQLNTVRRMVAGLLQGCDQKLRDTISCLALWLLVMRPHLLQIWHGDCVEMLLAAVIAGVPHIILSGQSLSPLRRSPYGFEGIEESLAFPILSNLMRLPGMYMTNNSRAGCRDYENWLGLPPGKVTYTPNLFDLTQWPSPDAERVAALRQDIGLPEQARVLGGMFRFYSVKDPELWVCTALRACAVNPDLYAVVGGEGDALPALKERIAATPFAKRVLFPGIIADVPAFLSLCDVFLHTAHVEGLPNAVLEAQACQVPVVTTRCGGVADIVAHGESGFVVDERDENVLARYIGHILNHADFAEQAGRHGRERVAQHFAPEVVMSPLEHLYARILGGEKKTHGTNGVAAASTARVDVLGEKAPLVSIVLPTYNHLDFLPAAVDSILCQTYPNYELIIVNDGSTDGTSSYLETLTSQRIRILDGPNTRLPTALNRGFALAQGVYRTWTSADNICLPHFCETLVRALEATPDAGFASAPFARIDGRGIVFDHLPGRPVYDRMFCNNEAGAAFMYRTEIARRVGDYDPELEGAEDWDMWLRILDVTRPVYVPSLLYQYRWHDASMRVRISDKVRQSSQRTANRALQRLEQRGGIGALYPQIAQCEDKKLAIFHANLIFGSRMIEAGSFLKEHAVDYLARAHALQPNDLVAMGNYAVALAWHGRVAEAEQLFARGMAVDSQAFGRLRDDCTRQQKNVGTYYFGCATIQCPGTQESELMRRVEQAQLVYNGTQFLD